MVAIAVVCLATHPGFRVPVAKVPDLDLRNVTNPKLLLYLTTDPHVSLQVLDYFCTCVFTLELISRSFVWPGKIDFFRRFFNIVDTLAVIPCFVLAVIHLVEPLFWTEHIYLGHMILSIASVFKSIRILKLVKHNEGLQIIYLSIRASMKEVCLLLMLLMIGTLIFSTLIYAAEFLEEDHFLNIPVGFWWSIITMTTVGYGDATPRSSVGYVVGAVCALSGLLITGLHIPVVTNNFQLYYTFAKMRGKKGLGIDINACNNPVCVESGTVTLGIKGSRLCSDDDKEDDVTEMKKY